MMTQYSQILERYRAHANRLIADNALELNALTRGDDGRAPDAFQVALGKLGKTWVRNGMRLTGTDKRFDRTIETLTRGQFTPQEIGAIEDRLLSAASWADVKSLRGVREGPPVDLSHDQKRTVDSLIGKIGRDPLGKKVGRAFGDAISAGQVRVR